MSHNLVNRIRWIGECQALNNPCLVFLATSTRAALLSALGQVLYCLVFHPLQLRHSGIGLVVGLISLSQKQHLLVSLITEIVSHKTEKIASPKCKKNNFFFFLKTPEVGTVLSLNTPPKKPKSLTIKDLRLRRPPAGRVSDWIPITYARKIKLKKMKKVTL